jgi:hypothetical protein
VDGGPEIRDREVSGGIGLVERRHALLPPLIVVCR